MQQKKEEAASLKKELQEKRNELKEMGGNVLKGDEVLNISKNFMDFTTFCNLFKTSLVVKNV